MTVLHCLACDDVVGVDRTRRTCRCGRSACQLTDAGPTLGGPARLLALKHGPGRTGGGWIELAEDASRRETVGPLL
jgi:hypothetical protein